MDEDEYKGEERRSNLELRERLDELFDLARELYNESVDMSQEELDEARARIEWLAEEIWAAAVYGPIERRTRRRADLEPGDE